MNGEGLHCEFKEARENLPKNLFETVCAFLNTDGGYILLGVNDRGKIIGIDSTKTELLKSDLANLSNNPQKVEPPYLLFPEEFEMNGKIIIAVQIPVSSQLHKTTGEIYLRSEDGDYRTKGIHQLAGLINRKLGMFTEGRSIPNLSVDDLRLDLFDKAKRLMLTHSIHVHNTILAGLLPKICGHFQKTP